MQRRFFTLLCCFNLVFTILPGQAQIIKSTPCGWVCQSAPAQSETRIGPALEREPVWKASLMGVDGTVIFPDALPTAEPDAFAPSNEGAYYVRFRTGALGGRMCRVTGSGSDFLALESAAEELEALSPGDLLEILPYWTLGTLYPPEAAGVAFIPSVSSLVRQTEVLFHDPAGAGINRSPVATYYFFNGAWRKVGAPVSQSFNGTPISPEGYVVQRNKAAVTTLAYCGLVSTGPRMIPLSGGLSARQDHHLTLPHPVPVTLRESGLFESGAFQPSASSLVRGDELLLFDPAQTGANQAPAATYYHLNGGWRRLGAPLTSDFSDAVDLPPGGGFILRKASGQTMRFWTFLPNL